jgi:hypothetical protein
MIYVHKFTPPKILDHPPPPREDGAMQELRVAAQRKKVTASEHCTDWSWSSKGIYDNGCRRGEQTYAMGRLILGRWRGRRKTHRDLGCNLMAHKYRGCIVVLSINKSVEQGAEGVD